MPKPFELQGCVTNWGTRNVIILEYFSKDSVLPLRKTNLIIILKMKNIEIKKRTRDIYVDGHLSLPTFI